VAVLIIIGGNDWYDSAWLEEQVIDLMANLKDSINSYVENPT